MGGINSLTGLNKISVDFRPTIDPNVTKTTGANQPQPAIVPDDEQPPVKTGAKSVVQQLDVLLLNAAGKSVATDSVKRMKAVAKSLVDKDVLTPKEASRLESLAQDAKEKLRALDRFSGRQLATALKLDADGNVVWKKGFFGLSGTAKAVKAAVEAQEALSEALSKFNDRLAGSEAVDAALQDAFTELQFQCDRRSSEIYSITDRMFCLVQQDVVNGTDPDPKVAALLDATFKELMPREAVMMHGTAEAIERMNAQMGPLVGKLADFAANGGKELSIRELADVQSGIETMKNALNNVRQNGLETPGGRIEVDKSLLDAMEKVLANATNLLANAKTVAVVKTRDAFLQVVRNALSPENASGGVEALEPRVLGNTAVSELMGAKNALVKALRDFAAGEKPMSEFDATMEPIVKRFEHGFFDNLEEILRTLGFDSAAAQKAAKTVRGIRIVVAQFKEMMAATKRLMHDDADLNIAAGDVRRILLGDSSLSSLVEAKALGFKPEDVDPAADESNIVDSRRLGSGAAGTTYLLTTKTGGELVFKPDLDGRLGLNTILLGEGDAYLAKQKTANLNLATQDAAKAFGCEDVVVKYSVGSHDGQFGIFMEKAKGCSGKGFATQGGAGNGGIPPAELHEITDPAERTMIKGSVAQKLNKLMWLDLITGQGDRHWDNYFVRIDKDTHEVTVKGIDNDASYSATRIGLLKFALNKEQTADYEARLKDVCKKIHGRAGETEYQRRVSQDPAIVRNNDGTWTVDLTKAKSPELKMAIIHTLGLQSVALPEEIDQDFYDHLMAMDQDPAKKQAYLDSIAPRVSPDALKATAARLDEAIAHAKTLKANGKVYGKSQWQNEVNLKKMTGFKSKVDITKHDGSTVTVNNEIEVVKDFNERNCPSFFKREGFQFMFKKPE